ncbi:MAG TPA: bifunctional rhamnulose-1-phosphate aldolase/short-chain dehydrogenase [Planctomycetota bacterium]|nr:bifunctional rhamnulose-1-phosphate aldolase/short-chain dehydrogenase [Planctomycetota bacterium]
MTDFKFVNNLWDDKKAATMAGDEVALLVYRSNLLGSDLRITNFGGGNTSCKTLKPQPLAPDEKTEVMYIKGSGGDLGSMKVSGLAALNLGQLRSLKRLYKGPAHQDEMVGYFKHCNFDQGSVAPSIETPVHGFLPFRHVDHVHADAVIAIAASADGEALAKKIYGAEMGWVPWQRPGFDMAQKFEACVAGKPGMKGLIHAGHGLFCWGDTAKECYLNTLTLIEKAARYLDEHGAKIGNPAGFGKVVTPELPESQRRTRAAELAPVIRGLAGASPRHIVHFRDDTAVLDFISREKAPKLAAMGTSCPDHFLRTKIAPLFFDQDAAGPIDTVTTRLKELFAQYAESYSAYYDRCKRPDSPAIRGKAPAVILVPKVGMFTLSRNAREARIAAEFYVNAINVMRGAESISKYQGLPEQEAFDIEYWLLEEAKIQRMPKEQPLSRQIAFVTGGASGIGLATAKKLLTEGAVAILADMNEKTLLATQEDLAKTYGADNIRTVVVDLRQAEAVPRAMRAAALYFGGIDIVVNNAGLSISKALADTTTADYDLLNEVMPRGSFLVSQAAVKILREQGFGGSIVYIASKNGVVAGPNNIAYGTAKAAQLHQMRLLAAEVGGEGIRVNAVNPDAVIKGSGIWAGGWGEGRAKAYGVKPEELGQYYAGRTLLKQEILPEDIANAVFAFSTDLFAKTTGGQIGVDGGLPMAFPR